MTKIQSLAAAHPRVGALLSPDAAALRGQLSALGFTPVDADSAGIDWVVTDGTSSTLPAGIPVLRIAGKVSVYGLEKAITALFEGEKV